MLVYGDHTECADPPARLRALDAALTSIARMPAGIERHAKLVGALIEAGQVQQGVEDAGAPSGELSRYVYRLAQCVVRSWDSGFTDPAKVPRWEEWQLPARVEIRLPEGFAFYAVYPEGYVEAARRLTLHGEPRVIGIRSIGTTLGAVVAAALGAPAPVTVRPYGNPFARQAHLPPELVDPQANYIIVDEGPGLSGSSFGCVADWLEARGVPLDRIAFLPSHAGEPGCEASEAHRTRWSRAQRQPAVFDPSFLEASFGPLRRFATGSPGERLKYRAASGSEPVLLKFAGLGTIGEAKLAIARQLHAAGLTAEPLAVIHGFLIERWLEGARPLDVEDKPVVEIGRYIGTRARLFPAGQESGASVEQLITMIRRNLSLALGAERASSLSRWDASALQSRIAPVRTDSKLDPHEWLRLSDGSLIKTDALDHHKDHDLIGCQDMAWDVAGAIMEFDLPPVAAAILVDSCERSSGRAVDAELLAFYRLAYCAFRLGRAALAGGIVPDEIASSPNLQRYLRHLQREASTSDSARVLV